MGRLEGEPRGCARWRPTRSPPATSSAAPGEISNAFGNFTHVTASRTYWDFLPSVNFSRDLSPDLVLRLAAARTMARPDYTDVSPRVSLNPGALTGQGGDPNIDPYRANQLDVSLERYHGKDALLSAAVFYKDIKSFITDQPVQQAHLIQTDNPNLALCTPAFTPAFPNRYSCQFTINQRTNGGGGKIKGLELAVLQPLGKGFGIQANYTYSDAEADDPRPRDPGQLRALRQPDRLLRERALRRPGRLQLPLGVLRHLRPLDAVEPGRPQVARRLADRQPLPQPLVRHRRRQPDQRGDPAVRLGPVPPAGRVRQRALLLRRLPLEKLTASRPGCASHTPLDRRRLSKARAPC
jgi:outer membrane receptor protein involved in Fe transport